MYAHRHLQPFLQERLNLQLLYNLHEVAEKHNDSQMADFVEEMMAEQVYLPLNATPAQ